MQDDDTPNTAQKTAEALSVLAGQVATIAGQAIGLQMAVGAIIEASPNRDALRSSIHAAWERVRDGSMATPSSESRDLVLQSLAALLQQIGAGEPPPPKSKKN
jgi:hypothetical protein